MIGYEELGITKHGFLTIKDPCLYMGSARTPGSGIDAGTVDLS